MNIREDISLRATLLFFGVVGISLLIIGKATYEQQFNGDRWRKLYTKLSIRKNVPIDAVRGTIYTEDGAVLSASVPEYDVWIDFGIPALEKISTSEALEIDSFCMDLSNLIGGNKKWNDYKDDFYKAKKYAKQKRFYQLLDSLLTYEQYSTFKEMHFARLGKNKNGIFYKKFFKRVKPLSDLASITIGKVKDDSAMRGLEVSYDSVLRGVSGKQTFRSIGNDMFTPIDTEEDEDLELKPQNGKDIVTNINMKMQEFAHDALLNMLAQNHSAYGTAMVMEVKTGKLKAIVNLGLRSINSDALLDISAKSKEDYKEYQNYALMKTEPGSTLKLITMMNLLDEGKINLNTPVDLQLGQWKYAANEDPINDAEPHSLRTVSALVAFEKSSNVGMAKFVYGSYGNNINAYRNKLYSLKLSQDSLDDIDLNPPKSALIQKDKPWHLSDLLRSGFGYRVNISPLRTLTIYNAIANNGTMMKPYLINAVKDESITTKQFEPTVLKQQLCKKTTRDELLKCLVGVCHSKDGTAFTTFGKSPYLVAGKTGTSYFNDGKIKYADNVYQSSFAGFFPANNPKYTCVVVIVNKKGSPKHFGNDVAAPVFKTIANKIYSSFIKDEVEVMPVAKQSDSSMYKLTIHRADAEVVLNKLNIKYTSNTTVTNDWVRVNGNGKQFAASVVSTAKQTMPLLKGMNIKDAVYLCESLGLKVSVSGKGKVNNQSIVEGTRIIFGQTVNINLN